MKGGKIKLYNIVSKIKTIYQNIVAFAAFSYIVFDNPKIPRKKHKKI